MGISMRNASIESNVHTAHEITQPPPAPPPKTFHCTSCGPTSTHLSSDCSSCPVFTKHRASLNTHLPKNTMPYFPIFNQTWTSPHPQKTMPILSHPLHQATKLIGPIPQMALSPIPGLTCPPATPDPPYATQPPFANMIMAG